MVYKEPQTTWRSAGRGLFLANLVRLFFAPGYVD